VGDEPVPKDRVVRADVQGGYQADAAQVGLRSGEALSLVLLDPRGNYRSLSPNPMRMR
jgi:hypothetical protein